jgi:hypothetical protein
MTRGWRGAGGASLAILMLLCGCGGETNRALFKRYEGRFAD